MKRLSFVAVAALVVLAGCSNTPERPGTYTTPAGERLVITYVQSAVSGSVHIHINGQRVASGSFGLAVGTRAQGGGDYKGMPVTFTCSHRYQPVCLVYVDGIQAAELRFRDQPPA